MPSDLDNWNMIYQLPNGNHRVKFYLGPLQKQLTHRNKKVLELMVSKLKDDYRLGKMGLGQKKADSITFETACDKYITLYSIPNGQGQDHYLTPYFINFIGAKTLLTDIKVEQLQGLKAKMLSEYAASTFNRRWTLLTGIFREAIKNGYLKENPAKAVTKARGVENTRTRYLTQEEINSLLSNLEGENLLFAIVSLNTGFRLGNLLRLEWSHIDTHKNVVHALKTKSGKSYMVPMNNALIYAFQQLRELNKGQYVFSGPHDWYKTFRPFFKALGWSDVCLHTFRHTFASHLVMKGADIVTVSRLMGHSSTKMSERYTHLAPDFLMGAVTTLNFAPKESSNDFLLTPQTGSMKLNSFQP